jgi:nucleoside-diphosphate-sugar epimerase
MKLWAWTTTCGAHSLERLKRRAKNFVHVNLDTRNRAGIQELFRTDRFDLIAHCTTQPAHDKAREIQLVDFEVNSLGTLNLLEATRQHAPEAVFALSFVPTGNHTDPFRCSYAFGCRILKKPVQQSSGVTQSVQVTT